MRYLKIAQAAQRLGVSTKTLRRWEKSGILTPRRTPGGQKVYLASQVETFVRPEKQTGKTKTRVVARTYEVKKGFSYKSFAYGGVASAFLVLVFFSLFRVDLQLRVPSESSSNVLGANTQRNPVVAFVSDLVNPVFGFFANSARRIELALFSFSVNQEISQGQTIVQTSNQSGGSSEIADRSVTGGKIAIQTVLNENIARGQISVDRLVSNLVFPSTYLLDLSGIKHTTTSNNGLILPNTSNSSPSKPTSGEGYLAYDTSGNQLILYNGSNWQTVGSGGGGGGDITTVTAGEGLTGGGDSGDLTLNIVGGSGFLVSGDQIDLDVTTTGTTSTTSSNSGLEVTSAGLSLIRGCSNTQILKWNASLQVWFCAADNSGSGGSLDIQEAGSTVVSSPTALNFTGSEFTVTESPSGVGLVAIDYVNSKISRYDATETLTNKTIAAGSNTITGLTNSNLSGSAGITNANLANSSVTINSSGILTGGGSVSLGGNITLTATEADTLAAVTSRGATTSTALTLSSASNNITAGTITVGSDTVTDLTGSGLSVSGSALTVSGLTTSNFASANISQFTNNSGYITSSSSDTLTNKTISGASNTITNIGNSSLTNSSVTINSSGILTGGGSVSLGGNITLTATEADTLAAVVTRGATTTTLVNLNGGIISQGAVTGKALVRIDETGDQNLFVASASGVTKFTLDRSGNVAASGNVTGSNLSGTNTGDQTITLTGDVTGTGTGSFATTIAANSVALTTDTTGNYVANLSGGNNAITIGGSAGEGWTPSVSLALQSTQDGLSSTTSNGSGLEITSGGLTLLQGCSTGEILKWNETSDTWGCSTDSSGGTLAVKEAGSTVITTAAALNFTGNDFIISDEGANQAGIAVDYTTSKISRYDASETLTNKTISGASNTITNIGNSSLTNSSITINSSGILTGGGSVSLGGNITLTATEADTLAAVVTRGATTTILVNLNGGIISQGAVTGKALVRIDETGDQNLFVASASGVTKFTIDRSGNVVASGTIAASNFSGSSSGTNTGDQTITLTGDVTGTGTGSFATTIAANSVALTTDTTGNYVATGASGNGVALTGGGSEGATLTANLGSLTGDWDQTGAFDITLNNSSSELKILESGSTPTLYGIFDIGDLSSSDSTFTFSGGSGTVLTTANYTGTLDSVYVNVAESPAAGDIAGSFSGGLTINSNTIDDSELVDSLTYTGAFSVGNLTISDTNVPLIGSSLTFDFNNASDRTLTIANAGAGTANLSVDGTISASNFSGSSSGTNTGDQTITLTGDVTGSGTGSFATTIASNSVALTADTTGNYVATLTNGAGITGADGGAEGSTLTLAVDQSFSPTWTGNQTFTPGSTSDLTVNTDADSTFAQAFSSSTNNTSSSTISLTNAASSGTIAVKGLDFTFNGTDNAGGANTITGINFGNATAHTNNTYNGLTFGTGYTNFLTSGTINIAANGTITGATLAAGSNTITGLTNSNLSGSAGITNANLANSSITINSSGILTGGGSVSLGGNITLTATEADTLAAVVTRGATTTTLVNLNGGIISQGAVTGKALVRIDETGDQNLFVASASGVTRFTIDRSGNVAASGAVTGSNLSGTNTGDQTITLTGDVTGSGTGSFAATIAANSVALTTDTTGNYVATGASGNGVALTGGGSEGATLTANLGSLTGDWDQTGAFDIALNNSSSELKILESGSTPTLYGIFDIGDLSSSDSTFTFSGGSGTVLTTANYTGTLDSVYVNVSESPAAGDIAGSFSGGLTLNSNTVDDSELVDTLTYTGAFSVGNLTISDTNVPLTGASLTFDFNNASDRTLTIANAGAGTANLSVDGTIAASNFSGSSSGTNTGDQTITLTGDVTGTGTGSFATTIAANSVALTADTTGNYVATLTNGAGITGADGGAEGSTLTLAVDQSFSPTWTGNQTFTPGSTNDLTVNTDADSTFAQVFSSGTNNTSSNTVSLTNSASSGTVAVKGLDFTFLGTDNASGANTITGINFGNATAHTNNTYNGLTFGTGYTNFLTSGTINIAAGGTITGSTIAAGSNTITGLTNSNLSGSAGITNANLANSSVTINSSGILTGGGTVSLGGTLNLTATEADTLASVTGRGATTTNLVNLNGGVISQGAVTGKALMRLDETGDQNIFVASVSGSFRLAIANDGSVLLRNSETISNTSNGAIAFTGVGQSNNGALEIDLETNSIPTLTSSTDTSIGIDEDLQFVGAQSITTSTGALTLQPASGSNLNVTLSGTGDFAVNTNQLYVDTSTGLVGIGTSSLIAGAELTVKAASGNSDLVLTESGGTYSWDFFVETGGRAGWYDITNNRNPFYMEAGAANNSFYIDSSGAVGIGKADPEHKLQVESSTTGKALVVINDTDTDQNLFVASSAGAFRFSIANDGTLSLRNSETISNSTNGSVTLSDSGGQSVTFDLDATNPNLTSSTGTLEVGSTLLAGTVDINGGAIDGTTIGGSSAAAGTFTNLTTTGTVDLSSDSGADTITIGQSGSTDDTVTIAGNVSLTDDQWSVSAAGVGSFVTGSTIGSLTFTTNNIADSGSLTIASATSNALTLDSGTTGNVNLGTGNNAKTIAIGTGNAGNSINIGTNNTVSDTITIGSALDNVAITGDDWSITSGGVLTVVSCTGCGGGGGTLDSVYETGNTLTTSDNRDVALVFADTSTDSNLNIDLEADNTVIITRNATASTETPAQLLLLENADADVTVTAGLSILESGGNITTGINVGSGLGVGINVNANTIENIGNAGTDFDSSGGLTLASTLTLSNNTITCTACVDATDLGANSVDDSELADSLSYTGTLTIASNALAVNSDSITADGATLTINAAGNVDVQDALNADSITSDAGVSIAAGQSYTGAGAVSVTSATGANALTLDSGSTGNVNLGTGNNAKTIAIGTGNAGNTINIGTNNTVSDTIAIGSALDNVSITGDQWSITDAGVLTVASCSGCGGGGGTLQQAYDATSGNTILTTTGRNIEFTLGEVASPTSLILTNQDTAGTTAFGLTNSIASGTLTNGILIDQTGAGTLTSAIKIVETSGTITDGLVISGTLSNILNSDSIDITGAGAITGATGVSTTTLTSTGTTNIGSNSGAVTLDSTGSLIINDATVSLANQATDFDLIDNTTSAFNVSEGSNNYLTLSTNNGAPVVTLTTPENGGTMNFGSTNFTRTINIGTGTSADTINIGTGATTADALTFGNTGVATTFTFNSGATTQSPLAFNFNSLTQGTGLDLSLDALTTGVGLKVDDNTGAGLTTGSLFYVNSVSTALTTPTLGGSLAYFNWDPASTTNATGDLFRINIGSNGNTSGNLFNITDNGASLFSVSENLITSVLPHNFSAAGDVTVSYDLVFTNQTSSLIDSYGPLTIRSGESFENNNLTLTTFGTGAIIADTKFSFDTQLTLGDSTTPSVTSGNYYIEANSTNRLVTNFTNGTAGQVIFIEVGTANFDLDCTSSSINCGTTDMVNFAAGDQVFLIYDGTNWNLLGWMDASANNDDNTDGVDIAEYFPSLQSLAAGEVVKVDINNPEHVVRSASAYENMVVGIVSTQPGITLGSNNGSAYPIALAGRVPVEISEFSDNIAPGDYITTSTIPGKAMKASGTGRVIGQALESWNPGLDKSQIVVFINNSWFENAPSVDVEGNLSVDLSVQNLRTTKISPSQANTDITIQVGSESTPSGRLKIENVLGDTVFEVDDAGDATVSGDLHTLGDLYATNIHAQNIEEIEALLAQVQADQSLLLASNSGMFSATSSATLNELMTSDLYVTNQAAIYSLSVSSSIAAGNDFVIQGLDSSINTLATPLKIQSLALAPVEIMGGLIKIDTNGNTELIGNLDVKGAVSTSGIIITGDTAGKGNIPAGEVEIVLQNPNIKSGTLVFITPTSPTSNGLYIKKQEDGKVTIGFVLAEDFDVTFNWWIVGTNQVGQSATQSAAPVNP